MQNGNITIKLKGETVAISDMLWSSFVEHVGRSVYNGIYEPDHGLSDEKGFRKDVIDCVKNLELGAVRYPGGNFVSAYDWKDGIGDKRLRKTKLNLAWKQLEPNDVGIDEFFYWCEKTGVQIIEAVNLGTKEPLDASEFLEYCNFKSGTYYSDMRIKNGRKEPYGIKYWCLGNEMGGNQIGRLSAEKYALKAAETARLMKTVDPDVKLVVCGSCVPNMAVFPEWEKTVLSVCYDYIDYVSIHKYYRRPQNGDFYRYLNSYNELQRHIDKVWKVICSEREKHYVKKEIRIFLDEYNIWNSEEDGNRDEWKTGNAFFEEYYTFEDALVLTNIFITILENADKIECSCLAQLVNVIAPIMTEKNGGILKQTIYYPLEFFSKNMKGKLIKNKTDSDKIIKEDITVDALRFVVTENGAEKNIVLVNNGDTDKSVKFDGIIVSASQMRANLKDKNDFKSPNNVVPITIACDCYDGVNFLNIPSKSIIFIKTI